MRVYHSVYWCGLSTTTDSADDEKLVECTLKDLSFKRCTTWYAPPSDKRFFFVNVRCVIYLSITLRSSKIVRDSDQVRDPESGECDSSAVHTTRFFPSFRSLYHNRLTVQYWTSSCRPSPSFAV